MYNYDYSYDISPYARSYGDYSSTTAATGLGAALGAFFGVIMVVAIAIAVVHIIAMWKVFTKAGEKGWKAIIPFYNIAILYKISGMSPWLVLLYIGLFIPVVNIFVAIAIAVMSLYQPINLAKAFNKSTGFTVGLIMVPFVFYLILGFGDSKYAGFATEVEATKIEE